jgi:hypothetical protein
MEMRNRTGSLDLRVRGDDLFSAISAATAFFAVKIFKSLEPQSSQGMSPRKC